MNAPAVHPDYLRPTTFVDADHPAVIAFAERHRSPEGPVATAVALFYAVRDGYRYNPYDVSLEPAGYRASGTLQRSFERGGHCIDKALLLAAAARAVGIPSRLHFANVRNHIGTAKLEAVLGTDLLVFHGYTELYLEGRWVAATPAFNKELCAKLGVPPLDWDGRSDAIFQAFAPGGTKFMEYVEDHGTFADLPFARMIAEWQKHYPKVRSGTWPQRMEALAATES
ncbi:MAG: transglutaminase family protein [Myxococcaceae bacterium]|nr:transglutaminase family protein [Myxococcaceae bacterium]